MASRSWSVAITRSRRASSTCPSVPPRTMTSGLNRRASARRPNPIQYAVSSSARTALRSPCSAASTGESAGGAQQAVGSDLGLPAPPRTTAAERPFAVDHQVADLAGVPLDAAERLSVHQETTTDADGPAHVGDLRRAHGRAVEMLGQD